MRSSSDGIKHNASVLLSHFGSDALPEYSLRHPDPSLPASKNRYAAALYDSYNPEILFGEVLLIPEWTQPNLSAEQIRLNGGVPPPPQPILPTEFTVQLYNPDQQVKIRHHTATWNSGAYWEFEMPQQSFRKPSTSALDRTQSDPTASENTPKLGFKWKKDGKLSKDYVCSLSGKSTNPDGSKRKNKEPDITIALFRHFKELTIYEPNLSRVDMEDPKGLEVVLLLGAVVIREVYNSNIRETFSITEAPKLNTPPVPSNVSASNPNAPPEQPPRRRHNSSFTSPSASAQRPLDTQRPSLDGQIQSPISRPPPTDPRTQWELDAETTRLRKQVEYEERERRHAERREEKRVKKMLEEEERKAREKQKEVDRETERLKKMYGKGQRQSLQQLNARPPPPVPARSNLQPIPQQYAVTAYPPAPIQRPHSSNAAPYVASNLQPTRPAAGPYLQPQDLSSASGFVGGPSSSAFFAGPSAGMPASVPKKKSFWGLRGGGDDAASRLTKQRSTVF